MLDNIISECSRVLLASRPTQRCTAPQQQLARQALQGHGQQAQRYPQVHRCHRRTDLSESARRGNHTEEVGHRLARQARLLRGHQALAHQAPQKVREDDGGAGPASREERGRVGVAQGDDGQLGEEHSKSMEASFLWENCMFPACEDRRSFELFRKDVIVYLMSVSNIVRKVVKEASSRRQIGHVLSGLQLQGWQQRQNQAEIELQMQQSCAETHRQKKKKRNKKAKVAILQQQRSEEKKEDVVSEEELALKAFLQSLEVEEERERCTVSEEWISRISPSSFFKK